MVIELSYMQIFWMGFVGGSLSLLIFQRVIEFFKEDSLSTEDKQDMIDMKNLGYLPVQRITEIPENEKFDCKAR